MLMKYNYRFFYYQLIKEIFNIFKKLYYLKSMIWEFDFNIFLFYNKSFFF